MLKIKCNKEIFEQVKNKFLEDFAEAMNENDITTSVCNCYDDDLLEELMELVKQTEDGFIFDEKDQIGEEPFGSVSQFFELVLEKIKKLKKTFPSIGIDGYFFVNDFGPYEAVCRQRVYATEDMIKVNFIDQLQCVNCHKWIDASEAYMLLNEEEYDFEEDERIYPSGYGADADYCVCSKECEEIAADKINKFE